MTIYLHAGTHKTGSKSLQSLLRASKDRLLSLGYDLYRGRHGTGTNHTELQLSSMRTTRDSFARYSWPDIRPDAEYCSTTRERILRFLGRSQVPHHILTNEDLSYLRHPDEFERLASLIGFPDREVRVVLVTRQRDDFLRSYTAQIHKRPNRYPSSDPASALYVGGDSWLCDLAPLIGGFATAFGTPPTVISYEEAMSTHGNVIPAVLEAFGLGRDALPWQSYFLNRSETTEDTSPP